MNIRGLLEDAGTASRWTFPRAAPSFWLLFMLRGDLTWNPDTAMLSNIVTDR